MKKITFLLALFAFTFFANGTVYLDETFDYTPASLLKNESGWASAGTLGSWPEDFTIGSTALTYLNSGGSYVHSGLGKSMVTSYLGGYTPTATSNYYVYKSFNSSAVSTGSVYVSFLYFPNNVSQNQSQSPIISLGTIGSNGGVQVWVGKGSINTSNFRFGTTRGSTGSGDIKWASTEYSDISSVYFVVLKYDLGAQLATIYINPTISSASEPTADASDNTSTSSLKTSLQTVQFKVSASSKQVNIVDGVRVSTTWAEAVAAQSTASPLATPEVGTASSETANGFTANWTQVENAVGYDVKVYLGTNLISTTNVSGQTTESIAITGLMSGLTYTYKVVANGDIINHSNSELSDASTNITTLDPFASNAIHTDFGDGSWGEVAESQPSSGTYPSSSFNGFDLSSAVLYTGSAKGIKGESHTNRIAIDKGSNGGAVTFPTVNSVEQIEIHATAGTAGNGFQLKEFDAETNTWIAIGGTYVYDANSKASGLDSIYIIPISRSVPTKFRIENPTNGGIYLLQVITRTTNPALLAKPTVNDASGISATGFTANWSPVANATAYKVYVYQGTTLISGSPFTIDGQSVESLSISELTTETSYSFKVQAIGDGDVSFSDSFLSFAGLVTTSIGTSLDELNTSNFAIVNGKKISLSETGNVRIFNLQGAQVYDVKNVNSANTNLATGLYILQFTNNAGKQMIQKIAIK
jgi:hypothetical protein